LTDWGELYSHVIACTGWTWDYIAEDLDLPRLESLRRYWAQLPPIHMMIAAYFGISPQKQAPAVLEDLADQQFIPAQALSESEFDQLLKSKGIVS